MRLFRYLTAGCLCTLLAIAGLSHSAEADVAAADLVVLDAKILTVDPEFRIAQALAVKDGRILEIGTNEEVEKRIGERTEVLRLEGKTVIPGVIETHCHAIGAARADLANPPYADLRTIAEVQEWIRKRAADLPAGRWIEVPRTPITRLVERRHPTVAELDAACTTHPVIFTAAVKSALNSAGFKAVGITAETQSVPGGKIIRDADGNPQLVHEGSSFLSQFLDTPYFTDDELLTSVKRMHQLYNRVGITSILERATDAAGYDLYKSLRRQNELSVRATLTIRQQFRSGAQVEAFAEKLGFKTGDGDDWVRIGPLKITVDGGIHWGTTFLSEAYGPTRMKFYRLETVAPPEYRGDLRYTVEQMQDIFATGHRLGWQMCCHVTGDAGTDRVLRALEAVHQQTPIADRRFNLIHAYFPNADLVRRASELGVCVDTQSYLYYRDADAMAKVYGKKWAEQLIGIGDWVRGGVPTAINSDHMIGTDPDHAMNSYNPFLMLYIAVSRKDDTGQVFGEHQKLPRDQALRCVTSYAAYLSFEEKVKGSLEPGKFADFAVLDRDYLTCPEEEIRDIKVQTTVLDGKIVFKQ